MIDLHTHLLPDIDDGPATMHDTLTLARAFVDAGTTVVVATPHVSWDYPHVTSELIADRVASTSAAIADAGLPLRVVAGAEVSLSRASDLDPAELDALTIGDGPWLLVEPPFSPAVTGVEAAMDRLLLQGRKLLLAHPERSPAFARDPERLRPYVDVGVICQVTSASLTGAFGREVQKAARTMVKRGLIGVIASDAHDTRRRTPGMADAIASVTPPELGDLLGREIPQAILNGTAIPALPEAHERSGGFFSRLRGR